MDVDYLATKNITLPLNQHLKSQPFALYMNRKYLHANISKDIRAKSHEKEVRLFLRKKYNWDVRVFQSIPLQELLFILKIRRLTIKNNLIFISIRYIVLHVIEIAQVE